MRGCCQLKVKHTAWSNEMNAGAAIPWSSLEMATHSSALAWRIPWTEEPGGLQSRGLQRVRHHWAASLTIALLNSRHRDTRIQNLEGVIYSLRCNYLIPIFSSIQFIRPTFLTKAGFLLSFSLLRPHDRYISKSMAMSLFFLCLIPKWNLSQLTNWSFWKNSFHLSWTI